MTHPSHDRELREVKRLLVESRAQATPLELDAIKRRAMAAASRPARSPRKGLSMRSRPIALLAAALLAGGTTAGGIAASGGGSGGSSANAQYHGVGNTHQCPPSSPRGKTGQPGPPCGNANGNQGTNNTGHH